MKVIERMQLIGGIATELQKAMSTVQINTYLSRHGVKTDDNNTYATSKRLYVESLLKDSSENALIRIGNDLKLEVPENVTPQSSHLKDLMEAHALADCKADFDRALDNLSTDSDQALGSACSTLESICKAILDKMKLDYPKDQSIQPLVNAVAKAMHLSPEAHADPDIKAILGGLASASQGIGSMRTKSSSAHGKGTKNFRLEERHARLAIGAAATIGIFFIETFQSRFSNSKVISEITRQEILSLILTSPQSYHGKLDFIDFLGRVFPLTKMPSTDLRFRNAREDIIQHMVSNQDWDDGFLLFEYLNLMHCDDEMFMAFVCQVLHPSSIIDNTYAADLANKLNLHLKMDGYALDTKTKISGRDVYVVKRIKL